MILGQLINFIKTSETRMDIGFDKGSHFKNGNVYKGEKTKLAQDL